MDHFETIAESKINYIKLINSAWQIIPFLDGYKGQHLVLFLAVVDSINRNQWKPVSLPLDYIINKIGFCRKVYTDSRNWLVENKLLEIKPGRNANQMAVFKLGLAVHIWTGTGTGREISTDTTNLDLSAHKRTSTGTYFKTINSIKLNKENNGFSYESNSIDKRKIEECLGIAMHDERWVNIFLKKYKFTEQELRNNLLGFNQLLIERGIYEKNPLEYKQHFANIKRNEKADHQKLSPIKSTSVNRTIDEIINAKSNYILFGQIPDFEIDIAGVGKVGGKNN